MTIGEDITAGRLCVPDKSPGLLLGIALPIGGDFAAGRLRLPAIPPGSICALAPLSLSRVRVAFNQPIGNLDTSQVTSMDSHFLRERCVQPANDALPVCSLSWVRVAFNQPIGNLDTAQVTSMGSHGLSGGAFNQ